MKAVAISTIGYEGISSEEFVARLKKNRIALLQVFSIGTFGNSGVQSQFEISTGSTVIGLDT